MDKSFNDQELSDIMKEIEALEDGFKVVEEKFEPQASAPEPEPEKVELHSEPVEEIVEMAPVVHVSHTPSAAVHKMATPVQAPAPASHSSAPGTSMSFKVSGDVQIQLEFDVGGNQVSLSVTESGLSIQMEGGMTFSVPLKAPAVKKAA